MGASACGSYRKTKSEPNLNTYRLTTPDQVESSVIPILLEDDYKFSPPSILELTVKCTNLVTNDRFALLNPSVSVLIEINGEFIKKAETDVVLKSLNPVFVNKIQVAYSLKLPNRVKFEVHNNKLPTRIKETVGSCVISLHQIASKPLKSIKELFHNGKKTGNLEISSNELPFLNDTLHMQWEFTSTQSLGYCFLRLFSIENGERRVIYLSQSKEFPYFWEEFELSVFRLCRRDEKRETFAQVVRIEGREEEMALLRFSLSDLKKNPNVCCEKSLGEGESCSLRLKSFRYNEKMTFLQYIHSGVEISSIYAVDFSQANESEESKYLDPIRSIQSILQDYTVDPMLLVFGFSGIFLNTPSHFFALTGNIFQPGLFNLSILQEYYKMTLKKIAPFGTAVYSDLIEHIYRQLIFEGRNKRYNTLIVLCSNDASDPEALLIKLRKLEPLAISVIFIAVDDDVKALPALQSIVNDMRNTSRREYLILKPVSQISEALETLSQQIYIFCTLQNNLHVQAEPIKLKRSLTRNITAVTKQNNKLNYYSNCKRVFLQSLSDSGYDKKEMEKIMKKGVPFFIEEIEWNHGNIIKNRSRTLEITAERLNSTACLRCGMNGKAMVAACGCGVVCEECLDGYMCGNCANL